LQDKLALFDDNTPIVIVRNDTDPMPESQRTNVKYLQIPYDLTKGKFDIARLLDWCGINEINNLWVEAGATLAAYIIEQQLFDQLVVYIAPKIMGVNAQDVMPVGPFSSMEQVIDLQLKQLVQLGQDMRLSYVNNSKFKKSEE
jgi:diaminohydroxyphosphoribosylaminopyrimidine deaminase/5-amino-6-(5-phosphoribosylamino)uracil reductase